MTPENRLIFDVGMHNGDDTAYYLHRGYRVVAIEADPTLAKQGRQRFAREIREGRLTLLNVGIAPEDGTATFWLCEGRSEWNSFDPTAATREGRDCRPIEVPCRRFQGILQEYGIPHYLKIDIETYDRHCLADLDPSHLPQFISIEIYALVELLQLQSLGYDRFKLVRQGRHEAIADETRTFGAWAWKWILPVPPLAWLARKGASVAKKLRRFAGRLARGLGLGRTQDVGDWVFPFGSSGPFGEEAPGEWLDFDEVAFRWLAQERIYPGEVWCDIHATHSTSMENKAPAIQERKAA